MVTYDKNKPLFKIWLEFEGNPILGKGGAKILEAIYKEESITNAAKNLGMSYRYVWNYLNKMKKALKEPIIKTYKGGVHGGGGARLTQRGLKLLKEYKRIEKYVDEVLDDKEFWEAIGLKISARNKLKGKIKDVDVGSVAAKVKIEIDVPVIMTALISKEAVKELNLKNGDIVEAVVKATEVMIAKE